MKQRVLTRKEFLTTSAKYAAGIAAGVGAIALLPKTAVAATAAVPELPWPYVELDVEEARRRGHLGFYSGRACSFAAFHTIITMLRDEVGEPYTLMPTEFLEWGRGGGWGWGTMCGALTGALTAMNICKGKSEASKLGNELLGWYTQTELPTDISNRYAVQGLFEDTRNQDELVQTACGSPLCHISVTSWVAAANAGAESDERRERCARLTGDVAAYAVQIMNDDLKESFQPLYVAPASVAYCMNCHGREMYDDSYGKMECTQCHGDHTGRLTTGVPGGPVPTQEVRQVFPVPFDPATTIRFTVPAAGVVYLAVYDVHGRLVKNLVDLEHYDQGIHTLSWDRTDNLGRKVPSGTYFYRLQAGSFTETNRLNVVL